MVDTINPNTNQPDSWGDAPAQAPNATTPADRFFGGFDKPDDVKINLADSQPAAQTPGLKPPVAPVQPAPEPAAPQPVHEAAAPVHPAEVQHTTYVNGANNVNLRGILVIVVIGLLTSVLVGGGIYFGFTAMNNSRLNQLQTNLDDVQKQLTALKVAPTPLSLPASATTTVPSTTTTPVTTPVVTPAPVETPQTTTPAASDDGSKQAAG